MTYSAPRIRAPASAPRDVYKRQALARHRQQPIVPEYIGTLADGTHDVDQLGGRLIGAAQVHDLVVGAVQRRTDKGIHAGGDTHEAHAALGLELCDTREQHAGRCHQETPRLEPHFKLRVLGAHCHEQRIELLEIHCLLYTSRCV